MGKVPNSRSSRLLREGQKFSLSQRLKLPLTQNNLHTTVEHLEVTDSFSTPIGLWASLFCFNIWLVGNSWLEELQWTGTSFRSLRKCLGDNSHLSFWLPRSQSPTFSLSCLVSKFKASHCSVCHL